MNKFAALAAALASALLIGATPVPATPPVPISEATLTVDGFGAVRFGMSIAQAEKALGVRLKVEYLEENTGADACGIVERIDGKTPDVFYMVEGGKIVRADVTSRDDGKVSSPAVQTAAHVGIGSSEADIRHAYGASLKVEPHPYLEERGHYMIVKSRDGKRAIIFETENGKVTSFRAGVYPPVGYIEGCA